MPRRSIWGTGATPPPTSQLDRGMVTALAPLLDLVGMAAELSDILALQLKVLWGILARRAVLMALPALVCGYGLILVHQRHGRKRA